MNFQGEPLFGVTKLLSTVKICMVKNDDLGIVEVILSHNLRFAIRTLVY